MGYDYGIGICRQSLTLLSGPENLESRMVRAFSEIEVITIQDASTEHFGEIKAICKEYLAVDKKSDDVLDDRRRLSGSLVGLCCRIIEYNSKHAPGRNMETES